MAAYPYQIVQPPVCSTLRLTAVLLGGRAGKLSSRPGRQGHAQGEWLAHERTLWCRRLSHTVGGEPNAVQIA